MSAPSLNADIPERVLPRVGIVLLNWNGYSDTRRCLDSLATATYLHRTIYVADNGSTDDSADRLTADCARDGHVFLRNGENLGFSAGCNRAIRRALVDGCDYVLLLNNDCIPSELGFIEPMVALAASDGRIGLVGGKLRRWPDRGILWGTGGWIRWAGERYIGSGEPDRGQYDAVAERGFLSGALMLIRREVLERVGLLPEEYFFGHEDWEYGLRVRRAGYRLMYQPAAVVYHEAEHSYEPARPYYLYNDVLSKILFKKRNLSPLSFRAWLAAFDLYGRVLMPLMARLTPARYLGEPRLLRHVMRVAIAETPKLTRVTPDMLERFKGEAQSHEVANR
jgi:GT2 family glycosyltransferase